MRVVVMAIIRCTDRDPICSLSRDRFLWGACLPTSLSLGLPHEHRTTHTFPAAQLRKTKPRPPPPTRAREEGVGAAWNFVKSLRPSGRSATGYGLGGRKVSAGGSGPSGAMATSYVSVFMFLPAVQQLALLPSLGPYPRAYTAPQVRSLRRAPGRLDHRPVHIVPGC